ncbi:MAG: glutaminyl-peptide cyclotransferase [Nevskia sp.]
MRIVLVEALRWALPLFAVCGCGLALAAPTLGYRVIATRPHDPTAFTEGLAIDHGRLFESTGRSGESKIVIRDLASLRVLKTTRLDDHDFGEGLAVVGRQIVQLTWKSGVGYLYDLNLRRTGSFRISSEGWGLTYDGRQLIRSDGSATLQMLDPRSFRETRRLLVHDGLQAVGQLNELEYAGGRLLANVWLTDRVAVIDPRDGRVDFWLDLSELKLRFPKPANWDDGDNVLNGIAYDGASGHYYVTGKCWPSLFEIAIDWPRAH